MIYIQNLENSGNEQEEANHKSVTANARGSLAERIRNNPNERKDKGGATNIEPGNKEVALCAKRVNRGSKIPVQPQPHRDMGTRNGGSSERTSEGETEPGLFGVTAKRL